MFYCNSAPLAIVYASWLEFLTANKIFLFDSTTPTKFAIIQISSFMSLNFNIAKMIGTHLFPKIRNH